MYGADGWMECGTVEHASDWAGAIMKAPVAAQDPDVMELARVMPYFAAIYGPMVPILAACQLDSYLDDGWMPVQWQEDGPVTMVPAAEMAGRPAAASLHDEAGLRAVIHRLHAASAMMLADDGTVIPLIPPLQDLVSRDGIYDPGRYRLAAAPRPATAEQMIKRHCPPRGAALRACPADELTWGLEEFLTLPWVMDYLPADPAADPRDQICERYGEKIPADLAVLDMAAGRTGAIAVSNAGWNYVEPQHLLAYTSEDDPRRALHRMHSDGMVIALSNGFVIAPRLMLQRIH